MDRSKTPRRMVLLTAFVMLNCIFWAAMDVLVFEVDGHWTLYRIYAPVFSLFSVVLWAWRRRSRRGLLVSFLISILVATALVGYGLYLLMTQPGWGVVTLLFVPVFVVIARESLRFSRTGDSVA